MWLQNGDSFGGARVEVCGYGCLDAGQVIATPLGATTIVQQRERHRQPGTLPTDEPPTESCTATMQAREIVE